ncbi:Nucleotide-binding, alpha-beta plait [Metarhizium album ARSEF 1941]|uniref:Nucleotide-binding, alpha-beta plait n=1 Tax=Metarhizium album (strain ARSEF 1941) TaxID=1081103 RepID=A0A0B2WXF0_METAS|nr:Nucleotide-binding, alpha-beta plait [Metarhizium album ARSEF 1941]KHN98234.1 Nucleotide-binding, alpha-beta plait [Metarhizium album ARSEF 1941]
MPVLMNDILQSAPEEQKEKIKKLLDIWEKGQTFPTQMIESFKEKLTAPTSKTSTTPPGSPPASALAALQSHAPPSAAPAPNGSSILEALANMARQTSAPGSANNNASNPPAPVAPAAPYSIPPSALPQPVSSSTIPQPHSQAQPSYPPAAQPVTVPSLPFSLPQTAGQAPALPNNASNPHNPFATASPAAPGAGGALDPAVQQQILLIKALADQGVPFDKIPSLIQSMTSNSAAVGNNAGAPHTGFQPPVPAAQGTFSTGGQQPWGGPAPVSSDGRDRGYEDSIRSPRYRGRTRSRSPDRGRGSRDSPRGGRGHGRNSPPNGRHDRDRNGRGGNDYRHRSPPGRRGRSPTPPGSFPHVERWVDYDSSVPSGHIKVYSRTLFVGGVTCSEAELRRVFSQFGTVQTCIVNKDKRHAFVKMLTRKDAAAAKESMEENRDCEHPLRTRWGVGFGPRDCSDYATGISIIPIPKLTEADRKWILTAPYGGSGGRPIESGLSVEEPDIEIGAGVSSKAISRRMQTDKGGSNGPKSTRNRDEDAGRGGRRGRDQGNGGQGSTTPVFPFGIGALPNGMPNFPSGFQFPDPSGH